MFSVIAKRALVFLKEENEGIVKQVGTPDNHFAVLSSRLVTDFGRWYRSKTSEELAKYVQGISYYPDEMFLVWRSVFRKQKSKIVDALELLVSPHLRDQMEVGNLELATALKTWLGEVTLAYDSLTEDKANIARHLVHFFEALRTGYLRFRREGIFSDDDISESLAPWSRLVTALRKAVSADAEKWAQDVSSAEIRKQAARAAVEPKSYYSGPFVLKSKQGGAVSVLMQGRARDLYDVRQQIALQRLNLPSSVVWAETDTGEFILGHDTKDKPLPRKPV